MGPVLTQVATDLWVEAAPLSLMGLQLGTRMTVARLKGGGLWLHSAIPLTPERKRAVAALGEVTHIVAPNTFHYLWAPVWADAFPQATLHGPSELARRRPELPPLRPLSDAAPADWEGTLVPHFIAGSMLFETVFVHPASRSVISSDLIENQQRVDHWLTRQYLRLNGAYQRPAWPRALRLVYRDRRAARASFDALYEHDFDRLILAHGDVLDTGAKPVLRDALSFLG